jgi:hypothetical protein
MKILLLIFTLFTFSGAHAQFAQWDWMQSGNGYSNRDYVPGGTSICTDAANNVYVLGVYGDSLRLDTFKLGGNDNGAVNMFLAKYDAIGKLLWITKATGMYGSYGSAINVDDAGNVYIGGNFADTVNFSGINLVSNGHVMTDIFMAKYDAEGNILWAKRAGGAAQDVIGYGSIVDANGSMTLDSKGYIYIAGRVGNGLADFDTIQMNTIGSLFLAKYDTAGNAIWAKKAGDGAGNNNITFNLALDNSGNIFLTGVFGPGTIYFDSISLPSPSGTYGYMFIAKYDNNGKAIWAKEAAGYSHDSGSINETVGLTLVTDKEGNVIIAGDALNDTTVFDNIVLAGTQNIDNGFIAKYSSTGSIMWAKNMNELHLADNYPNYMSIDASDNLYIIGSFKGACTFSGKTVTSNGGYDIYVTQYNDDGNLQWLTSLGGTQDDAGFGITTDNAGAV